MSGYNTKTVNYHDGWDVGKSDSKEEAYHLEYHGTSDVVVFIREGREIASLPKGEAWLFYNALKDFLENEEEYLLKQPNPFKRVSND